MFGAGLMMRAGMVAALMTAGGACVEDPTGVDPNGRLYGPAQALGNGTARVYIQMENGQPAEVGVALSESALTNLPGPVGGHGHEWVLALPSGVATPYQHVTLGWNPEGHEPEPIYGLPHFDFHFYTISNTERLAIDPSDPQFATKAARLPAAEYRPATYFTPEPVEAVPHMGVHWIDPQTPELNGQVFTKTFIYGSWDGKLIFLEPMITKAYLEQKLTTTETIRVPSKYAPAGRYPTSYAVRWNATAKQWEIALTDLVTRN